MSIEHILRQFCIEVVLRPSGEYVALCPFHSEKHPSFYFNAYSGLFNCRACKVKGKGVQDFLEKLGLTDAALLDGMVGALGEAEEAEDVEERGPNPADLSYARARYNELYSWRLHDSVERRYLFGRYFLSATLDHFHVRRLKNVQQHTIFVPLVFNGYVYGYQRRASDDVTNPKYWTMPGLRVSQSLYGEVSGGTVLLCEGITDVWMARQRGVTNCVATLGAKISDAQWQLLMRYATAIVCAYHLDSAGYTGYADVVTRAKNEDIPCVLLELHDDIAMSSKSKFYAAWDAALEAIAMRQSVWIEQESLR